MPSIIEGHPRIHYLPDFNSLSPEDERLDGVGLLCVDLENIFVPFGGDSVVPADALHVASHRNAGRVLVGITNMRDHDRAQSIADQLGMDGVIAQGMRRDPFNSSSGFASKSHGDMFLHAINAYGFGKRGRRAAMLDDQLENVRGVNEVSEFTDYFWTFPNYFSSQHMGVFVFRPIEVPIGFGLMGLQAAGRALDRATKRR